jgi:hypothetical protein
MSVVLLSELLNEVIQPLGLDKNVDDTEFMDAPENRCSL